ncbi:AMP binding protein [Dentipellis sp. KUC8613]|nr:AMP binding protein [Dentipellis sp. KUC8613]
MRTYPSLYPPTTPPITSVFTHLLSSTFSAHPPSSPAFTDAASGTTLTRAALRGRALQFAHGLRHDTRLRFARGDTVLVLSPNSLAWPIALFGLIAAGAVVSTANPAYTPAELAYQYRDSRAYLVFVHPELVSAVLQMFKIVGVEEGEARKRVVVMRYEGVDRVERIGFVGMEELLGRGEAREEERFDGEGPVGANETVFLCYSSGTTGKPKGVMLTHKNIVYLNSMLFYGISKLDPQKDVLIAVLPFYHAYGLLNLVQYPLLAGTQAIVMPRWDTALFCQYVARYRISVALVVPPMLLALVHHPATQQYDMTSLNYISCGAAPAGKQLTDAAAAKLASVGANVLVTQAFGMTEMSPHTHQLRREDALRKPGSIGVLLPNLTARLVLPSSDAQEQDADAPEWDDGEEPLGGPGVRMSGRGELWIKGPTLMKGYLNNAEATRNSVTTDGWYKSGDIMVRDEEGYWYAVDRQKELIKYKGFQVAPAELEALLLTHPKVVDVAVIGIDAPALATELPRAYIVPSEPQASAAAFEKEIQDWFAQRVAQYKRLRGGVAIVDSIPKSPSGKILRRQLRDRVKAELDTEKARAKL